MRLVIAGPATLNHSPLLLLPGAAPGAAYSPSKIGPGLRPSSSYTWKNEEQAQRSTKGAQ